ncbi:hypothetical protein Q9323_14740 [Pseudomonas fulva]|uniref:hypothetical protein n=1 Tax=Pseudomonas fulva TaxID=47880 RepID=UPI0031F6331E
MKTTTLHIDMLSINGRMYQYTLRVPFGIISDITDVSKDVAAGVSQHQWPVYEAHQIEGFKRFAIEEGWLS